MQPLIVVMEQDFGFLLASIPGSPELLQSFHSPIASFDPHSFVLNVGLFAREPEGSGQSLEDGWLGQNAEILKAKLDATSDPDEKLAIAIRESAWLHEHQHFQDCMFTPVGAYQFAREALTMHALTAKLQKLRNDGHVYTAPLRDVRGCAEAAGKRGEDVVAIHAQLFDHFIQTALFNGDLASFTMDYDARFESAIALIVKVPVGDEVLRIPYYPQRVSIDGEMKIVAQSFGFRAITEARATHLQNELIASADPKVVSLYTEARRYAPEYSIANMMFTKRMRQVGASSVLDDMSKTGIHLGKWLFHSLHGSEKTITYPGLAAIELLLTRVSADGFEHEIYSDEEFKINSVVQDYCKLIMEHNERHPGNFSPVLRFALKDLVLPGLEYFAEDQKVFPRDWPLEPYMQALDYDGRPMKHRFLPDAIAQFYDGQLAIRATGEPFNDPEFRPSWYFWIALRTNLAEAWRSDTIRCILVHGDRAPMLAAAGVELHEHCARGKLDGSCGSLRIGEDSATHIDCPWRQFVRSLGLVR